MIKVLCPIHHYYYNGTECPLCAKERNIKLCDKYTTKSTKVSHNTKETAISENMLDRLKEKFNCK